MINKFRNSLILCLSLLSISGMNAALACSRILLADKDHAVMVARSMDWFEDMKTNLWAYPQGMHRDGAAVVNSLEWTSKYGSVVATGYDIAATDGINEVGLAAHLLALPESDYGKRDASKPGLSVLFLAQYYLDNFRFVDDAVRFAESDYIQIEPYFEPRINKYVNLHLALEDCLGDSAVIEYINGVPHVYHNADYKVLTNSPGYDLQLQNLKQYGGFGGDKPLPGTTDPQDRFVRASYYANHLPAATSVRDELTRLLGVLRNVAAPYGVSSAERPNAIPTIWMTVSDLTNRVYYFQSVNSLNMVSVQVGKLDLRQGAPVMKLDLVNHSEWAGDVTGQFEAGR